MFRTMYEGSQALRARCNADINRELDYLYKHAQIDRRDIVEAEILCRNAEPGEWKAKNGQIVRGDKPVNAQTLLFLSWCWKFVPALLRTVYKLEALTIDLIAKRLAAKVEENRAVDALEKHRAEIAKGQTTGSDHEFDLLIGCARMGAIDRGPLKDLFRRWCQGHSIEQEVFFEYSEALKRELALIGKIDGAPDRIKEYFRVVHARDKPMNDDRAFDEKGVYHST